MMNLDKIDTVLYVTEPINEGNYDDRSHGNELPDARIKWSKGGSYNYDDPRLYANNAFGRVIQNELNSWKQGYSSKVTDFGKWVVVEVTYHHHVTGRSASKTFLVVFDGGPKGTDKGGGMILSTANKWRTVSGATQAVSYIKSASGALESSTSQKI